MKNVVITGSTRGIGFGLADAFLSRGCRVMVSGRKSEVVQQAVTQLAAKYPTDQISGHVCDVTVYEQVHSLWDAAKAQFGQIDIWINNAGTATILTPLWELTTEKMQEVVNTNILGTLYGTKVALLGMFEQGHGSLYNMEGFGSRGNRTQAGLTLYGLTKASVAFLNDSLVEEIKSKPIIVGSISPGMVTTDMLLNQRSGSPKDWERSKRVFNILADKVETVSPWLVDQILSNQKNGTRIQWLTGGKIMWRFLSAPFTKRSVID